VRLRKIGRNALIVGVPLLVGLVYAGIEFKARRDLDRRISAHLAEAKIAIAEAHIKNDETEALRRDALALFDANNWKAGEATWDRALSLAAETEKIYARAAQSLESALAFDGNRKEVRSLVGNVIYDRILLAERDNQPSHREELLHRLALYDETGERTKRLNVPAMLSVTTSPAVASVTLERYVPANKQMILAETRELGQTPLPSMPIEPGTYTLIFKAPGRVEVRYPCLLKRAETLDLRVPLLPEVPPGFIYIPAGRFLFGSPAEKSVRSFLSTVPMHEVQTDAYFISRTETTYADWISFLSALPPSDRLAHTLKLGPSGVQGALELTEMKTGGWQLTFQPSSQTYSALQGQPIRYQGRSVRVEQNWQHLPVSGVSLESIRAYTAWLNASGRIPGARLCSEHEWERAARGADARIYPHGDQLEPEQANYDETYGKNPLAFGPDQVGTYPASRSPFGLDDMTGNVWEWTHSSIAKGEYVARGGSYYTGLIALSAVNRERPEPTFTNITLGLRICVTPPPS
jgi:formylglycine-generating enzyme required for sulfatase activity